MQRRYIENKGNNIRTSYETVKSTKTETIVDIIPYFFNIKKSVHTIRRCSYVYELYCITQYWLNSKWWLRRNIETDMELAWIISRSFGASLDPAIFLAKIWWVNKEFYYIINIQHAFLLQV